MSFPKPVFVYSVAIDLADSTLLGYANSFLSDRILIVVSYFSFDS